MFENVDAYLWQTYEDISGGADPKMWVTDGVNKYLLKKGQRRFPLEPISEYVVSRVFNALGMPVQDVELVRFRGDVWAKCSYVGEIKQFKDIGDSSIFSDVNKEFWVLVDLLSTIAGMKKLSTEQRFDFINRFKMLFVLDALVANGDRHAGNFGYLTSGDMAPVYDNGAALFPDIRKLSTLFNTVDELLFALTVSMPISSIQVKPVGRHEKKESYYAMILGNAMFSEEVNKVAVADILKVITNAVDSLSQEFQRFYTYVLLLRFRVIIQGVQFNRAYAELKGLPFKFPESVGELCSKLRI